MGAGLFTGLAALNSFLLFLRARIELLRNAWYNES